MTSFVCLNEFGDIVILYAKASTRGSGMTGLEVDTYTQPRRMVSR